MRGVTAMRLNNTLSFLESFQISITGLLVVFLVLLLLAAAIMASGRIIGIIMNTLTGDVSGQDGETPAPGPAANADASDDEQDMEILALLHGAISMESGLPADSFKILSIRECPDPLNQS